MKTETDEEKKQESDTQNQLLLLFANSMFLKGIEQHPKNNSIHLFYILFLIERFKNPTMALGQIAYLETKALPFESQYLLFRYRNIIKEELLDSKNDDAGQANVQSVIVYESQLATFNEKIEKTAILHLHIWSLLLDETPDLSKILIYGFKIEQLIEEIEEHWERIQEINNNVPKVMMFYAMFVRDILNDKETSNSLMEKARDFSAIKGNINRRKMQAMNTSNISVVSPDGTPCIYISGQQNKAGIITQCNLAVCRLFGYTKKELMGNNIKILMPEMYAEHHQEFLLKNIQKLMRGENHEQNLKDRQVFGKNKSGYVFPLWFRLFSTPTLLNNSNYIGLLQIDKKTASGKIIYFLLDKKLNVCNMSSTSITMLGLHQHMIKYAKLTLTSLCPEIDLHNIDKFQSKSGEDTNIYLPDLRCLEMSPDNEQNIFITKNTREKEGTSNEIIIRKTSKAIHVNCIIQPITTTDFGLMGYFAKFEEPDEEFKELVTKEVVYPTFQFRYDDSTNKFIREFKDDKRGNIKIANSVVYSQQQNASSFSSKESCGKTHRGPDNKSIIKDAKENKGEDGSQNSNANYKYSTFFQILVPRIKQICKFVEKDADILANKAANQRAVDILRGAQINYGENIITYRLIGGELEQVNDDPLQAALLVQNVNPEWGAEDLKDSKRPENSKKAAFLISTNIKSRKSLETILSEGRLIESTALYIVSYILFAGLIAFAISDYIYISNFFSFVTNHVELIKMNYNRLVYEQAIMYYVRELTFTNM